MKKHLERSENITVVLQSPTFLRAHPAIQLGRFRDHAGKDSPVQGVMKLGAENTLDVRQVQKRRLVKNL